MWKEGPFHFTPQASWSHGAQFKLNFKTLPTLKWFSINFLHRNVVVQILLEPISEKSASMKTNRLSFSRTKNSWLGWCKMVQWCMLSKCIISLNQHITQKFDFFWLYTLHLFHLFRFTNQNSSWLTTLKCYIFRPFSRLITLKCYILSAFKHNNKALDKEKFSKYD